VLRHRPDAIRCHILRLKGKTSIPAGAPPRTLLVELTVLPQTLWLYLKGPTSKEREREEETEGASSP